MSSAYDPVVVLPLVDINGEPVHIPVGTIRSHPFLAKLFEPDMNTIRVAGVDAKTIIRLKAFYYAKTGRRAEDGVVVDEKPEAAP